MAGPNVPPPHKGGTLPKALILIAISIVYALIKWLT